MIQFTLDAFGEPLEVEWCSNDHRHFASRSRSLRLHSFEFLEASDSRALQAEHPAKLQWCWIQDYGKYGEKRFGMKPKPKGYPGNKYSIVNVDPVFKDMQAEANILLREVHGLNALGFRDPSRPDPPKASGIMVAKATLESGKVLWLKHETGCWREVPSEAEQLFLSRELAAKAGEEHAKSREWYEDPIPWGSAAFDDVIRVLSKKGLRPGEIHGAILFAYGYDRRHCASVARITPRHFTRKVLKIARATDYKPVFSRSEAERAKGCTKITERVAAQLREKIDVRYSSVIDAMPVQK